MATVIRKETRKRGFFGKLFKFIFIAFNVVMAIWFFGALFTVGGQVAGEANQYKQAGGAVGMALGMGFVGMIWAAGAAIFGTMALATRGAKVIVEETVG
jgi:hypothetical protein